MLTASSRDHAQKMRSLIRGAKTRNSRMVAAAIGSHLSDLSRQGVRPGRVEAVRDASLRLLTALHSKDEAVSERQYALITVEALETAVDEDLPAVAAN